MASATKCPDDSSLTLGPFSELFILRLLHIQRTFGSAPQCRNGFGDFFLFFPTPCLAPSLLLGKGLKENLWSSSSGLREAV